MQEVGNAPIPKVYASVAEKGLNPMLNLTEQLLSWTLQIILDGV